MKPLVVVITFSSPYGRQTLDAIVFTAWKGILKPGKKPTMHLVHCDVFSNNMCSVILRQCPTGCRGMGSKVNLVLESETRTLSAHEVWMAVGASLVAWFLLFWFFVVVVFNMVEGIEILGMVVKDGGSEGKKKNREIGER
jgi:hypothetical protein